MIREDSADMQMSKMEITHPHTKQLIADLNGRKNPKQVIARNAFERRLVYEYCEQNGWNREIVTNIVFNKDIYDWCKNPDCDLCMGGDLYVWWVGTKQCCYTTFRLWKLPSWTKKQVRQPLIDAGIADDVIVNTIYPYLVDLY